MDKDESVPFWLEKGLMTDDERIARTQTPENNPLVREILSQHRKWVESEGKEGARLVLSRQDLRGIKLVGANMDGAVCTSASFKQAQINGTDFKDAFGVAADFSGADLRNAKFRNVRMTGADLAGTDISRTRGGRGR